MSWRIAVRHLSHYRYSSPVVASFNEARLTPAGARRQIVLETDISTRPSVPLTRYVDYWSTVVHAFDVHEPHSDLTVTGNAVVETLPAPTVTPSTTWSDLQLPGLEDRYCELLSPTSFTAHNVEIRDIARTAAAGTTPYGAVLGVFEWIQQHMAYEPGTTKVSTSAVEAWHQRGGVCQDFAHLAIAMLRGLGVPTRYVSGYLHPLADAPVGETVSGASHAWIEVWLDGWIPFDPTNGAPVGERHVTVAHGRDYGDVSPLRGVYHGGALEELTVAVDLTRLA